MYLNLHFSLFCKVVCSFYNYLFLKDNKKMPCKFNRTLEISNAVRIQIILFLNIFFWKFTSCKKINPVFKKANVWPVFRSKTLYPNRLFHIPEMVISNSIPTIVVSYDEISNFGQRPSPVRNWQLAYKNLFHCIHIKNILQCL